MEWPWTTGDCWLGCGRTVLVTVGRVAPSAWSGRKHGAESEREMVLLVMVPAGGVLVMVWPG